MTRKACVIAWPAGHSRSPLIHNYWIKLHALDASYELEAVPPDDFENFVGALRERGYVGANCTIPHKEAAFALSQPDDAAKAVGASNTLWFEGNTLRSTNTDVEGFLNNLDANAPGWDGDLSTVVLIGAGGAARAVIFALLSRGALDIYIANRSMERAEALAERFGERVHPVRAAELGAAVAKATLIVNTSSLGMSGQPPLFLDLSRAPTNAVVTDLVYDPLETALLRSAKARGLRAVDGLGMLLHQAVGGFERWFGVRPDVTPELRALVEADLRKTPE